MNLLMSSVATRNNFAPEKEAFIDLVQPLRNEVKRTLLLMTIVFYDRSVFQLERQLEDGRLTGSWPETGLWEAPNAALLCPAKVN
jgi:hypothetical protein